MTLLFDDFFKTFGKIGILSFGGPAGQIALMHKILVDEKQWLDEKRFLHALNFCMLLPGPEAMQLATYAGWMLRGVKGGLLAGLLFVLPGALVMLGLSMLYVYLGEVPLVAGLLFGLKAAVLAIVLQALFKVAKRALKGWESLVLAVVTLIALAVFSVPFPIVILAAGVLGAIFPSLFSHAPEPEVIERPVEPMKHVMRVLAGAALFWLLPLILLVFFIAPDSVFAKEAAFFSKAAVVTFGGAYAVLAYVGQQAVDIYGWLKPDEMLAGLGLAETTPGPLILVLVFVGFVGAFRDAGLLDPLISGMLGAMVTLWVTFVPCFIWIFLGAPFVEVLRGNKILAGSLAAITAAVVGVIANLSIWFGAHVLFDELTPRTVMGQVLNLPILTSLNLAAAAIAIVSVIFLFRGGGLAPLLIGSTIAGIGVHFLML
jgi:chromate transporter